MEFVKNVSLGYQWNKAGALRQLPFAKAKTRIVMTKRIIVSFKVLLILFIIKIYTERKKTEYVVLS